MLSMYSCAVIAFALAAAVADVMTRRIPRQLTLAGALVGLAVHALRHDLASTAVVTIIAFACGLVLFRLGAIGGGDVKLVTALAALLGAAEWPRAMFIAVLVAAVLAIAKAVQRGVFFETLRNTASLALTLPARGLTPHPTINARNVRAVRNPFAFAAAVGTIAVLVRP